MKIAILIVAMTAAARTPPQFAPMNAVITGQVVTAASLREGDTANLTLTIVNR